MNTNTDESKVLQVPIEDIIPNRAQPRVIFDDASLQELADSIKEHGIIQPLVLRRVGDKYEIVAGERRYRAAKKAGLAGVPAIITTMTDAESAEVAIVENIQRKDLTAIEEARSYKAILDKGDLSQSDLAKKMGVSQSAISNKLRLLTLDEEVQKAVLENKISERHARSLLKLTSAVDQRDMLNRIINERLTVKQLDGEIKKKVGEVPLVNSKVDVEKIKEEAVDIEPVKTETVNRTGSENVNQNNKFFNFLEEAEVNMNVDVPAPVESPLEPVQNIPEPVVEETTVNQPEEVEMLDDFNTSPQEDNIVDKLKAVLEGKNYTITDNKVNNQQIINIIINN